jgi:excisionase family DNA binding protein
MPRKPSLTRKPSLPTGPADITHADTVLPEPVVELGGIARDLKQIFDRVESLVHRLQETQQLPTDTFTLLATQEKRLFTVEELARLLNVDSRVIYGLRHKGLPAHRVGRELRFDLLEVKAWLEQQQRV